MKRFIDLGNQTGNIDFESGEKEFAFYCTISDTFEMFSGSQTWKTVEEFIKDYDGDELERFISLIPKEKVFYKGFDLSEFFPDKHKKAIDYFEGDKWEEPNNVNPINLNISDHIQSIIDMQQESAKEIFEQHIEIEKDLLKSSINSLNKRKDE